MPISCTPWRRKPDQDRQERHTAHHTGLLHSILWKFKKKKHLGQGHPLSESSRDDDLLQKLRHVPEAEAGRGGRDQCMQDTRVDLLRDLLLWAEDSDTEPVFWLNGMAGTGKTTIAETLALIFEERSLLAASFFCSRASQDRSDITRIFPTIAYRLARKISSFQSPLLQAIEANGNAAYRDLLGQFKVLIESPLADASKGSTGLSPKIVVIDALDECADANATKLLLDIILKHASVFSPAIKFFVTSRPEPHIQAVFESDGAGPHSILRLHEIEASIVEADVKLYMIHRLGRIEQLRTEYPNWPPSEIHTLARQAGRLFIFASAVCAFVEGAHPVSRFRNVYDMAMSGGIRLKAIDELYAVILDTASKAMQEDEIPGMRRLLEAIVVLRNPLRVRDMEYLLHVESPTIRKNLGVLQSAVQVPLIDNNAGVVKFFHASFLDYLTDPYRSGGKPWAVDVAKAHANLARRCLDILSSQLYFNVTKTIDSHLPADPAKVSLDGHLTYACLFWIDHLRSSEDPPSHTSTLEKVFRTTILYWLEVMSAMRKVDAASVILQKSSMISFMSPWLKRSTKEWHEFVIAYADPLNYGPAHLYLSALPWLSLSRDSLPWQTFGSHFPPLLALNCHGTLPEQHLPVLRIGGHTDTVTSAVFSPNGRFVVSGSHDNTVRVWDAITGEGIFAPFRGHTSCVTSVAVSPDSESAASGSEDCAICIWNIRTGSPLGEPLRGHTEPIRSVAFSSDGKWLVSGSDDSTIRTWNTMTGESVLASFTGHTGAVYSVTLSPSDNYIISGSADKTVGVWDSHTGEPLFQPLQGHDGIVFQVVCSLDGSYIASCSSDRTIRVWHLITGELLSGPFRGHTDWVRSVAFSPNGRWIVSGSDDMTIRVWDMATWQQMSILTGYSSLINSVHFSSDGRHFVSASDDRAVCIWEAIFVRDGPVVGHRGAILSVAFSPEGEHISSGSGDNTIRCWDSESGEALSDPFDSVEGHTDDVASVVFSPDGKSIASGSDDTTVRIWNVQQHQQSFKHLQGHTGPVRCVAISPDGKFIVSASKDTTLRLWDTRTGKGLRDPIKGHTDDVNAVAFSPDGKLVASGSDDETVRLWAVVDGASYSEPFRDHATPVWSVIFSRDGKQVISGDIRGTIRLWNVLTGESLLILDSHNGPVTSISNSPDGQWIASGSHDQTVMLWSTSTGEALSDPLVGHIDWVESVAVSPDGKYIISGSYDGTIRKWNVGLARRFSERAMSAHKDTNYWESEDGWETTGWVSGQDKERLFWVPPQFRRGLRLRESNTAVIGIPYNVKLDLSRFVHGEDWMRYYELESKSV